MNVVILLNGEPHRGEISAADARVICCDGAYGWAQGKVKIDELIGDFDSLAELPEGVNVARYPAEKDMTDGELAIERALALGATHIEIYGGGGGREDHFLGNVHLLYKAHKMGVKAVMFTNRSHMFISDGACALCCKSGTTVSIVPFGGEVHIMESRGLKYPLPEAFVYGSTRGISNVVLGDGASFRCEGAVLVVVNNLEVE